MKATNLLYLQDDFSEPDISRKARDLKLSWVGIPFTDYEVDYSVESHGNPIARACDAIRRRSQYQPSGMKYTPYHPHHLWSSIGWVKSIPKGTMGMHLLTTHPTFSLYQFFIIVTTSDPYLVIFGKSVLDLHLANIWIFVGRSLIGSQAGAASLVEGRPVLHHFKLWREATQRVNLNA